MWTSRATSASEVALTYIYGIGRTRAQQLLATTGVDPNMRVHQLGDEELVKLRDEIESNFKIEGDLRREVQADIRRKIEIGSYQGRRHRQACPSAVSAPRPTRAPARVPSAPSPARRRRSDLGPGRSTEAPELVTRPATSGDSV